MNYIKHHKILEYYKNYDNEKVSYSVYFARIKQQWMKKENAIKIQQLKWKHMIKTKISKDWRICTKCLQYKERKYFSKTKNTLTRYTSDCLECRRKAKQLYREKTKYNKDHEYKKKRRSIKLWTIICMDTPVYIDWIPREDKREVIDYKYKKWYMIKSLLTWYYKWIDLWDNGDRPKFYLLN